MWLCAWELARRLPEAVAFGLSEAAGGLAARRQTPTRARVRANLAHVVADAELDDAVTAAFRSYARYWIESFRAADMSEQYIHERVTTASFDKLDAVLDQGRGAIILLAHLGSWDVAARWAELSGYHLAVVAEVVRPRRLFARFVRLREAMGLEVVPLLPRAKLTGTGIAQRLGEVLADNHMVGLLTDRDLSGSAPLVDFFGAPCRLPVGAAILAKRNRVPVVPIATLQRPRRRWHFQVFEPLRLHDLSITDAQQQVADALEAMIRLDPTQWHAFQPIWPDTAGAPRL